MADKSIGELPVAPQLDDDSLLVVEQQGEARSIQGRLVKGFARESVSGYVEQAKEQADAAEKSAQSAAKSAEQAAGSASDAAGSAESAKEYSGNPPIIQGDTWWTWNAEEQIYVDTGEPAKGDVMLPVFYLDETTGDLYMYANEEYTGPDFRLRDGYLEVVLSA